MKISVSKNTLLTDLGIAARAASSRSAVQTLAGVMVHVEDGKVELLSTDMEMAIRVQVDGEVEADGIAVLPARLLVDVVRSLPSDRVDLERTVGEQDARLSSGSA